MNDLRMRSPQQTIDPTKISRRDFPSDFVFGAATAAYQIEGGAKEGGRGPSIWDTYTERNPAMVTGGTNGNMGVNSYNLYKEDVTILKNMGVDAYRFSISWSRVLPGGRLDAGVNNDGIEYYNNLINDLLANGIQPYVTLFHWDLPQALEDEYGGFLSSKVVDDFVEFVELCFWEFGDRVKHWITVNEPWSYSVYGYVRGTFPPCRGAIQAQGEVKEHAKLHRWHDRTPPQENRIIGDPGIEPYWVAHHLLLAHAAAVDLYRNKFKAAQQGKIGITLNTQWIEPWRKDNADDIEAVKIGLDFLLGWFLEPVTTGDYPQRMKTRVKSRLPIILPKQAEMLRGSYDFVGINYYSSTYATPATDPPEFPSYDTDDGTEFPVTDPEGNLIGPTSYEGSWLHSYPKGIREIMKYIKDTYNDPEIYITENGLDEQNDTSLTRSEARNDEDRVKYLQDHLTHLLQAIKDYGVRIKGYFVWSLVDNFEWASGFTVRFGIVHINYNDNYARYPKKSALWYMNSFGKKRLELPPAKRSNEENNQEVQKRSKRPRNI